MQEYALAGKVLLNKHFLIFFESCIKTNQPTYLCLDALMPNMATKAQLTLDRGYFKFVSKDA